MAASRLVHLFEHVSVEEKDRQEVRALKKELMLQALKNRITLSVDKLKEMALYMVHEMHLGLEYTLQDSLKSEKTRSTLRMLPGYVYRESPNVDGIFYGLDLGGTNFRVLRMVVRAGKLDFTTQKTFKIPYEHMTGNAEGLFGFIAHHVIRFLRDQAKGEASPVMGFTFSYPMQQTAIASATLIKWTKGFTTSGVVDHDVVGLLQKELLKRGSDVKIIALCNDTVGTLITRYFTDEDTEMGVILGTGSNGCYWERSEKIRKEPHLNRGRKEMVINMECGNFDSYHLNVLPTTTFDDQLDAESPNPGNQRLEKMISGMYLGEISRRILVALSSAGALNPDFRLKLSEPYRFQSAHSGLIAADHLPGLHFTRDILLNNYAIDCDLESDRMIVREVCQLVGKRSAQLAGMFISATLLKTYKGDNSTIAIDGSVFEKTPYYRKTLSHTISDILGPSADVRLVLQKDGSGLGAGYIAALTHSASRKATAPASKL